MITRLLMGAELGAKCRAYSIITTSCIVKSVSSFDGPKIDPDVERRLAAAKEKRRIERMLFPPTTDKIGYQIKLLCPSMVTDQMPEYGASWIKQLSQLSGANITISLDGEFFPFTEDRVMSISGSYDTIVAAVDALVMDLIKPKHNPKTGGRYPMPLSTPQHVRILIPQAAADFVVGEEGCNVMNIVLKSRCDVRLEIYDKTYDTQERIMAITTKSKKEFLIFGTQLAIRQVLSGKEIFPYISKSVTYGNGRFERVTYEKPEIINLKPQDSNDYSPFFKNLISGHKAQPKDPVTGKYIWKERTSKKYDKKPNQ